MFSSTNIGEDFVMTPIKCPPPKIVAVKRSLKSKRRRNMTRNIMDDENDSDVKEDFINEEDFENDGNDARDLIEFEREEPLIDLSDSNSNENESRDTVKDMNAKNSNSSTITMLLDLLEIGRIESSTGKSEIARLGSCAEESDCDTLPTFSQKKVPSSASSSLNEFPLEYPDACAESSTGKLELSTLPSSLPQPLSAIQPEENPSIVKNYSIWLDKSHKIDDKSCLESLANEIKSVDSVLVAINTRLSDCKDLQKNSHSKEEKEKSSSSIFTSISKASFVDESSKASIDCCLIKDCTCARLDNNILTLKSPPPAEIDNNLSAAIIKSENVENCEDDCGEQKNIYSVKDKEIVKQEQSTDCDSVKFSESSDKNNNNQSLCNQNYTKAEISNCFSFLSSNTSQREFPPKFFSSTSSLNRESCFEASTRLKRLEERFKGFSHSKKLLRSSKVFSKSEEILSSCGKDTEFKSLYSKSNASDSLNSSSLLQFPLTTFSTFSDQYPQLAAYCESSPKAALVKNNNDESNSLEEEIKRLPSLSTATLATLQRLQSPDSSTESDEICKIFRDKDRENLINNNNSSDSNNNNKKNSVCADDNNNNNVSNENCLEEEEEEDCSFIYYEEEPGSVLSTCEGEEEVDTTLLGQSHSIFNDISFSNCEFDVQTFKKFLKEEKGEGEEEKYNSSSESDDEDDTKSDESDFFCDCLVETVPLYHQTSTRNNMRETGAGKLRGLLKQPNRPANARKNRVVFDETRNEFFEADYIILIREDCPYDEEDEEPCTCGDHELVRICCDEGCNCGYTDVDEGRTPPSPKYAPPIEFVDQATLSPPEGYKDGSLLDSALSDALSNHVFGAQHIQQLQVIQRLQQQRAAMLAARAAAVTPGQQQAPSSQQQQQQNIIIDPQTAGDICPECTQCSECAAAKLAELEAGECDSQCSEQESPMEAVTVPQPHVLNVIGSLVPISKSSPERRNQKEIVAGEERPKFLTTTKTEDSQAESNETSYVVETITTTTTVTEHTIIRTAEDSDQPPPKPPKAVTLQPPALPEGRSSIYASSQSVENMKNDLNATIIPKFNVNGTSTAQAITGILKGGKLRKTDSIQNDETNNTTSDEETSSKRSVRFNEESGEDGELQNTEGCAVDEDGKPKNETQLTDYVTHMSLKRHSSLFHNALRPNSAVRQLFPAKSPPSALTHEALKAFEESKRSGNLLTASQAITSGGSASSSSTSPTPTPMNSSDTDTIKRTIERNALRRSLIKYEPKKKVVAKDSTSLEERIRQLTCDIDEPIDSDGNGSHNVNEMERRDSPAGEETPQQPNKFDKSFSPSSSASSSSSCSTGSTYKKITDLFNKEKRQEKIPETDENPIVIQDCRCGPDLGMGVQIQHTGHSHTHHNHPPPPPPRSETTKRQFLNTLAPLTACVAGQRDDNFSYYIAAKPGDRTSTASSQTGDQYSIGDIDAALQDGGGDGKKVAPDVIAGTPMNCTPSEQDELVSFAQQEANRMDRIKKRYSSDSAPASGVNSDDDEQNDYGFNKRPSVRGIKARFGSTNEILQQMQDQLSQPNVSAINNNQAANNSSNNNAKTNNMQSATLPRTNASGQLQIANTNQQQNTQQNSGTWAYYPDQQQQQQGGNKNYYHLPAHARHSYHGEAIYQNCHTMTVQQTQQAIIPGHVHQKLPQQPHAAAIHAIQHAQQINRFSHFARSPTRRPESPPPLRNYHQTMVLIPYKANGNGTYATYGIASEGSENIYQRQHNIVEYQQVNECKSMVSNPDLQIFDEMQVTQQTIRIPIGSYPIPGMQLHVVNATAAATQRTAPHYATLPRQNSAQGANPISTASSGSAFIYPEKPMESRGVPEGEAATVQQTDCTNNIMTTCQDGESNNNPPGTVYYAMNV